MQRGGLNPFKELKTFLYIWRFFKNVKPDIVHLVTIKPYLYGGFISRLLRVPCLVSAVSGLGTLFVHNNLRSKFLRLLIYPIYHLAFNHLNQKIIVQNEDDSKVLVKWGVLNSFKVELIKGSGVNLKNFTNLEEPLGIPTICIATRLLREKGIYDFVSAADLLVKKGIKARFYLAGDIDVHNPTGLTKNDLNQLKEKSCVEILGYQKDIPSLYAKSNIICLPSYREGFPKSLIEAAAASRAVVTTDVPGCRDAIIPNKTGLLVPAKDPQQLANTLQWLIENPHERIAMGKAGRKLAEKEFMIEKIVLKHLEIYQELLNKIK
jgi:glycosyltransferase involved in cell wall biosynthesis